VTLTSLSKAVSIQPLDRILAFGVGKTLNQADQTFQSVKASLNTNDLSSAKSGLSDLKKLLQSTGAIGAANSIQSDFTAIGTALGAGNVTAAQKNLQQLQTDVQVSVQQNRGPLPRLLASLPGGNLYQAGLGTAATAAKTIGNVLA
jgi:hypothetical protein